MLTIQKSQLKPDAQKSEKVNSYANIPVKRIKELSPEFIQKDKEDAKAILLAIRLLLDRQA